MSETDTITEYRFSCPTPNGIHARPATKMEQIASGFSSEITIENLQNGKTANVRSILSLIAADIKADDDCVITFSGDDSAKAKKVFSEFIDIELPAIDDKPIAENADNAESYISPVLEQAGTEIIAAKPVTTGFGKGKVVHIDSIKLPDSILNSSPGDTATELDTVNDAFDTIRKTLNSKLSKNSLSPVEKEIIQAHLSILNDIELKNKILSLIQLNNHCSGKAILEAFDFYCHLLGNAQSQLIRERIADLHDVRNQLIVAIYGSIANTEFKLNGPSICIADSLSPSEFISLDKNHLKGLILKEVGSTSHTVILARSCNTPIITDVQTPNLHLPEGQEIIIDSNYGLLIPEINEQVNRFYDRELKKSSIYQCTMAEKCNTPTTTKNGLQFKVMANIAMALEVESAINSGADGIGLFRTEMMLLGRDNAPNEQEMFEEYSKAAQLAQQKPVTIRTFDIGGDKKIDFIPIDQETNPTLGFRGVRIYSKYQDLIKSQLKAILRASAFGNIQIAVPMIASREEIIFIKELLDSVREQLDTESAQYDKEIKLGIMIEVPSAAYSIPQISDIIDFINIGTNDLKQYFFAVDRENQQVSTLFPDHSPAFLSIIDKIVSDAHDNDLKVCICGEIAGNSDYLPFLIGTNIDSISVSIPYVSKIKAGCSKHDSIQCRSILKRAAGCDSAQSAYDILDNYYQDSVDTSIIEADLIDLHTDCNNKEEVIKYITDVLYLNQRANNYVELEKDFWEREKVYSTGLGHGFAIPHCKTSHISQNSICVFRLKKPIEWQSIDNQPVSVIIAMSIRDKINAGNTHITIFSKLARNIMHEDFREQIKNIPDKNDLIEYIGKKLELNSI